MARGLRVAIRPIFRDGSSDAVVGGTVDFVRRGKGTSNAVRDTFVDAKLSFVASCFASARSPERKDTLVAKLLGKVTLAGSEPFFVVSDTGNESLFSGTAPPSPKPGETPRTIRLDLGLDSFELPLGAESNSIRIFLPWEATAGARYLELIPTLEIAGSEEGPNANDVLDIRLVPRPIFGLRLVDEVGVPLDGVSVDFVGAGTAATTTTDDRGRSSVDDLDLGDMTARVVDDQALRQTLKARWNKPRKGPLVAVREDVVVVTLDEVLEPVALIGGGILTVSVQPDVTLARLVGMVFDTNKSFLLPTAIPDFVTIRTLFDEKPDADLLVVGHTDTTGEPDINDPLSLERAESVSAYLTATVDVWLGRYRPAVPEKRRWSDVEDQLMLLSLPDVLGRPADEDPIRFFQRTRGLQVDGKAGDDTRRALIGEYMALDETTVPTGISITTHGAGEFFPLGATGDKVDSAAPDSTESPVSRRVELFFFDKEFGIQPPPPGKNSKKGSLEYPEWRRRANIVHDNSVLFSDKVLRVRMIANDEPLANVEYALDVDGRRFAVARTDGDGLVLQRLPVGATLVQLKLPSLKLRRSFEIVKEEDFPSIDTLSGVQLRLAQLNFFTGAPSGKLDPLTGDAIRAFKRSRGLADDTTLDAQTKKKLEEAYGS